MEPYRYLKADRSKRRSGRWNLGNNLGATFETSAPVPAEKPDLRHYPRKRNGAPEGLTRAEKIAYLKEREATRPATVKWRTKYGVCDEADGIVTHRRACKRDGCGQWFAVQRSAGSHARWPEFCSEDCRDIVKRSGKRRNSRRVRNGETSGAKRPRYTHFDPDAPGAWQLAYDIVMSNDTPGPYERIDTWATGAVYAAAEDYLAQCDQEVAAQDAAHRAEWDYG